jgi:signal transduction histidine kinase
VALESLAEWALAQFADRVAKKGVALQVLAEPACAAFTCDRQLLELILRNLLDNAVKFTTAGGRVDAAITRQAALVRLRVADTGCGISRQDQPRVFERFFQADAARTGDTAARGTGLGLAIVKHACERLGATVLLESDLGQGTTVTVLIPDRTGG